MRAIYFPGRKSLFVSTALSMLLTAALPARAQTVDVSTVDNKVFAAYQGWFHCPGDPGPNSNWFHWTHISQELPTAANSSVPNYPISDEYPAESRCPVPNLTVNGKQAYFFTSLALGTAETHFRWMRQYHIDGAILQRFLGSLDGLYEEDDIVLRNAVTAAQDNGRSFFIEYDISGDFENTHSQAEEDAVFAKLTADWLHLVNDYHITSSPNYQKEKSRPVVSLWGMAQGGADITWQMKPALAKRVINWFHDTAHATVMGGVTNNFLEQPDWADVIPMLDIVQPWNVGVYKDQDLGWQLVNRTLPHVAATKANGQIYMPTIIPASSSRDENNGNAPVEGAESLGGKFFWDQAYLFRANGVRTLKVAMFDELGEGTSLLKTASNATEAPSQYPWINLDVDGLRLPNDWNLRVAYEIAAVFHGDKPLTQALPTDPGPLDVTPECGVLHPNEVLSLTQPLYSCDGTLHLSQDSDGDLAVYRGTAKLYSSGTAGLPIGTTVMQGDGNLVEYDHSGVPRWASGTAGHDGAYLYLRNDGATWVVSNGTAVWQAAP